MTTAYDQNGERLYRHTRRDSDGTWSANVWFGCQPATTIRRYYGYATKREAQDADISEIPENGRIGTYDQEGVAIA